MKKKNKELLKYLSLTIIVFLIINIILINKNISSLLLEEIIPIVEYFRTLYLNTKVLIPDLALNIGNGINIFYLTEYGFLNPFITLTYIIPSIKISNYFIFLSIILPIISIILLYRLLYKNKLSNETIFISSIIFITSTSLTYYLKGDIIFLTYLPFLILSLLGIEKVFNNQKSYLLSISTLLMIITSYKYSIISIPTIIIYATYRYLKSINIITTKSLLKTIFSIITPIIVGILISSFLTIPVIYLIINDNINLTTLYNSITPNIKYLLYGNLGLGLTSLSIISITSYLKKSKPSNILNILTIIVTIISFILKIDILITLIPLYIIIISNYIETIFKKKLNIKILLITIIILTTIIIINKYHITRYIIDIIVILISILIYYRYPKKQIIIIPIIILSITNLITLNINKPNILKNTYLYEENIISDSLSKITNQDNTFYRIDNQINKQQNSNRIFDNLNYYSSNINTNIYNKNNLSNETLLAKILHNNKYIISNKKNLEGYELINSDENINIYKNDNTFTLGYASSNLMSYEDYYKLDDIYKEEALLNVIVADTESKNNFIPKTTKITLDNKKIFKDEKLFTVDDNNNVKVSLKEKTQITYKLPKKYRNKILYINFNITNLKDTTTIKINNIKNQITNPSYNKKYNLNYILEEQDQTHLIFTLTEGTYSIQDFKIYMLDYADIEKCYLKVDKLKVDAPYSKGDYIKGLINVVKDGYFTTTLPYDKGYKIKVNNIETKYEKVNDAYIGFPITKGTHYIEIEYNAPGKPLGYALSIFGSIIFIVITYLEGKRKF